MSSLLLAVLRRVDDAIALVENVLISALCAVLAVLLFGNVALRYLFRSPVTWIEEVVVAAFVWMIFIGVSACVRSHQHLRIDVVPRLLSGPAKGILGLLGLLCMVVIVAAMGKFGYDYAVFVSGNLTPILGISAAWLYIGLPLGMAFTAVHLLRQFFDEGPSRVLESVLEREG
ncbi:TRAP transporter small permease [Aquibaculum sediminis]|uniref:TRAP transporter small permease n=1 Tax=Aquibaculum sediminis TaxID=3231907 RepID=UPI003454A372